LLNQETSGVPRLNSDPISRVLKNRHIILVGVWILAVGLGLHTLMICKGKAEIPATAIKLAS